MVVWIIMFWRDWKTHRGPGERSRLANWSQRTRTDINIGQRNTILRAIVGNFKMATHDRESFWLFVSNLWLSWSSEPLVVNMDADGIRRPPKPASQLSTALFMNPQLDLTPEKKTNKPKQNGQKNISEVPTENKTGESKEIYAWYVYCDEILSFQREQAMRFCWMTTRNHAMKFIPVQTLCDEYKCSFWPRTFNDWNSLPPNIMNMTLKSNLKKQL